MTTHAAPPVSDQSRPEPVLRAGILASAGTLVGAFITALVAFGVPISGSQRGAILGVVTISAPIVAAAATWLLARPKVTPLADPRDWAGRPLFALTGDETAHLEAFRAAANSLASVQALRDALARSVASKRAATPPTVYQAPDPVGPGNWESELVPAAMVGHAFGPGPNTGDRCGVNTACDPHRAYWPCNLPASAHRVLPDVVPDGFYQGPPDPSGDLLPAAKTGHTHPTDGGWVPTDGCPACYPVDLPG